MSPDMPLKVHQPVAVKFILNSMQAPLQGCIVADKVGLRKTIEATAAIRVMINERMQVESLR